MRVLYPSDPFNPKMPDENYREEYEATIAAGVRASTFSFENFEAGSFKARPENFDGEIVLYRGWMMTPNSFTGLVNMLAGSALAFTSPEAYRLCHYLPEWYPLLANLTSDTVFHSSDADFPKVLADLAWSGYFVKDFVKSLNTAGGSLVDKPEQIASVVKLMREYRGQIEGGVCIRRREEYVPNTERRYFVLNGTPYSTSGDPPQVVVECAKIVNSPFFSVDVVLRSDGVLRVVELGDGQVSDRKEWSPESFAQMLRAAS